MTLSAFNPKLLNFLYELTKLDSYKSSTEIAKSIKLERTDKVTPKTIRNWFKYLGKPYRYLDYSLERKLSYFPCTFKNKLGLAMINVFFDDPSPNLFKLFPLRNFVGWLYDPKTNKPVLVIEYVVPMEHLDHFLSVLYKLKSIGLCNDLTIYKTGPSFRITSPFHKVIDSNGIFHPDRNDPVEINRQMRYLDDFLEMDFKVEMLPMIKRNPIVIPVLAEYMYEHRSSLQVWRAIKSKLGDSVWDYIKHNRKKSDGVALRRVQLIMNNLAEFGLLNQMRVVYFPIELGGNFTIYMVLNYKNENKLLDIIGEVTLNSIFTNIFPLARKKLFFASLINVEAMQKLFELFLSNDIEKLLFFDHLRSMSTITTTTYSTFDYRKIFNPDTCSWVYNQGAILAELEDFA